MFLGRGINMRFCDYQSVYVRDNELELGLGDVGSRKTLKELGINNVREYAIALDDFVRDGMSKDDDIDISYRVRATLAASEASWIIGKQPYYDVYPSVIPVLENLKLDFPLDNIRLPMGLKRLLLRFPVGSYFQCIFLSMEDRGVFGDRGMASDHRLMINCMIDDKGVDTNQDRLTITTYWNAGDTGQDVFDRMAKNSRECNDDHSWSDSSDEQFTRAGLDEIRKAFVIAMGICLIGDDPSLLEPQVLRKDEGKTGDREALVERARRKGRFGFSLGEALEKIPHLRRPHMAWVAYGPKHSLRRFQLRKHSIVHRDKIESLPTGFLEGSE
jgi:hypothetical protein